MDVEHSQRWRAWWRSMLLALIASATCSLARADPAKIRFDIPASEFSQAIIEFSKQSQVEILYASAQSISGLTTRAVSGELAIGEALEMMLDGTGFTFEFESARSVLLRQATLGSSGPAAPTVGFEQRNLKDSPESKVNSAENPQHSMKEVIITGSHIHGLKDIVSPLVVMGEREKKQAAYGSVQDVLRTLTQNFGASSNEDFSTSSNFMRGAGLNLRGLGSSATLVLVNGRRQPVSGIQGDFVDVTTIPFSAVDRIEILPDGSSALYGSDAISGVVNVILREDVSGIAETQTRLGSALGGGDETLLAQFFGSRWHNGRWLLGYQYSKRTALPASARSYAANADKRAFGGSDFRTFFSNPANVLDPLTGRPISAIPANQDGKSLTTSDLLPQAINLQNQLEFRDLLPNRSSHSVFFTGAQDFAANLELFAEGRFTSREMEAIERAYATQLMVPASNPFFVDAYGGAPFVLVAYNFLNEFGPIRHEGTTETYTGTLGIKANLSTNWRATLSGHYGGERMDWKGYGQPDPVGLSQRLGDSNPETAFNPFGSGSNTDRGILDSLLYVQRERSFSQVRTISLNVDGPLFELAAGMPMLAFGIDQRRESLSRFEVQGRDAFASGKYGREVIAAFTELSLPLPGRLSLSLAGRYEAYRNFGETFNPKIGLRWTPLDSLRLRGSWGSSFRAPTLVDLFDHSQDIAGMLVLADAESPTGYSVVLAETGTNPNLQEEKAKTWTAGFDFVFSEVPGLTVSTTYYAIDYGDQIFRFPPTFAFDAVLADDRWSPLVNRNPTRSEIERICSVPLFFGSRADCLAQNEPTVLDLRIRNLSATKVKGIDLELKQTLRTGYGMFNFGLNGSYMLSFEQAVSSAAPVIDLVGVALNPVALRLRGMAGWNQARHNGSSFGVNLMVDYLDDSREPNGPVLPHIDASTTFDVQLTYRTQDSLSLLGGMELTLNAVNLFNRSPPFVNREEGYDPINAKPYGRVVSVSLQKNW